MQVTLLILFLISQSSCAQSHMKEMVRRIASQLPQAERDLLTNPYQSQQHAKRISGNGFKYYSDSVERYYYKGVETEEESINNFFDVILDGTPMSPADKKDIKTAISPIAFTKEIDLKKYDVCFDKNARNNSGAFFSFMVEKKDAFDDHFDLLMIDIKNKFVLAPDIFIMTKGSGNIFVSRTEQYLVERSRSISHGEFTYLLAYFQVSAFKNTDKLMEIIDNL